MFSRKADVQDLRHTGKYVFVILQTFNTYGIRGNMYSQIYKRFMPTALKEICIRNSTNVLCLRHKNKIRFCESTNI